MPQADPDALVHMPALLLKEAKENVESCLKHPILH
jgi:hypothetical protein